MGSAKEKPEGSYGFVRRKDFEEKRYMRGRSQMLIYKMDEMHGPTTT